jgi:class 3 adenylate cyclase
MPKPLSQFCYRLNITPVTERADAVEDLVRCIREKGSAAAVMHDDSHPALRTLFVTDLVDSTATLHKLGDELGRAFIAQHDVLVRSCLHTDGGIEIAHTGDGVIASFASPSRALHCACALQEVVKSYNQTSPLVPMQIRIGVHAGRPIVQDDRLLGSSVNAAVRVCAKAAGGQILVSHQVFELISPQWFRLLPCGPTNLRGVPEPIRIYEVDWEAKARSIRN